jgi:Nitrile hydratase, alpha chain
MDMRESAKQASAYGKIIAKAWCDPAFKARLLADPHAALAGEGISVLAGVTVKVVENTATEVHLVLPPKPAGELSDEQLATVAGGAGYQLPVHNQSSQQGGIDVYQGPPNA